MEGAIGENVRCLGYSIFYCDDISKYKFGSNTVISTINAYSYVIAETDDEFKEALKQSDILLPDGFPIVFATKFLQGKKIKKIAGEDIFKVLIRRADLLSLKVFFLGSSENTLNSIYSRFKKEYSNASIFIYSPPFKDAFSKEENDLIIESVNTVKPDILFVGMTAPKQEKWVAQNRRALEVNIICSIGAVFDFYAGTVKRPSKFWINMRLEWFIRFIKEPKRLWKRYFICAPQFFHDVIREKYFR